MATYEHPYPATELAQRYATTPDGERRLHDDVKESRGIAAAPSPMAFLTRVLERPDNERPFVLFPVGYPTGGCLVPDLDRTPLDQIMTVLGQIGADQPGGPQTLGVTP